MEYRERRCRGGNSIWEDTEPTVARQRRRRRCSRTSRGINAPLLAWMGVGVLFGVTTVSAQHTEAVCSVPDLSWSFNSLGQSPCLIAAFMANPCSTNDNYDVPAIGPGFHYNPSSIPSTCECSTVTYSLYSACAACQNATIGPWSLFIENCTKTNPDTIYPVSIPPGTAVPRWAYQSIVGTNRFNLTLAQSVGDSPENVTAQSTSVPPTIQTPGGTVPGSPSQTNVPGGGNNNNGNKNNKASTPIGGIVGGVVGGIGGLALIGGALAFFLLRRKKNGHGALGSGTGPGGQDEEKYRVAPYPVLGNGAGAVAGPGGVHSSGVETGEAGYMVGGHAGPSGFGHYAGAPVAGSGIVGGSSPPPPGSSNASVHYTALASVPPGLPTVGAGVEGYSMSGGNMGGYYTGGYQPVNPVLGARPYDPEDPSTFPPMPRPGERDWSNGEPTLIGTLAPASPTGMGSSSKGSSKGPQGTGAKWDVPGHQSDVAEI